MKHTTVSGHVIDYDPSPKARAFLAELAKRVDDPRSSESDLVAFAFAPDNPILDSIVLPGHGMVTAATLADPCYAVMNDMIYRKSVAVRGLDLEKIAEAFSMTVAEAAQERGVHESAIRQAIEAKRLATWMKNGRHYLRPESVKAFEPQRRGPKPSSSPLRIVMGSEGGRVMHVHAHGGVRTTAKKGGIVEATTDADWLGAMIFSSDKETDQQRSVVIEPSAAETSYNFSGFSVSGRFRIVKRYNNSKAATQAWKEFRHDVGEHSSAETMRKG